MNYSNNNGQILTTPDILISKLDGAGIDKLVTIYGNEFKRRITNMKASSIPLEDRRKLITKKILEAVVTADDTVALSQKILDTYFVEKKREEKNVEWLNEFQVGEEILVYTPYKDYHATNIWQLAVVNKINKKTISVSLYGYDEVHDNDAVRNQTYGNNRLIWNKSPINQTKKVVSDRRSIIKKGANMDHRFTEGLRSVDYGN